MLQSDTSLDPGDIAVKGGPLPAVPIQIDFLKPPPDPTAPFAYVKSNSQSLTGGTNPDVRIIMGREFDARPRSTTRWASRSSVPAQGRGRSWHARRRDRGGDGFTGREVPLGVPVRRRRAGRRHPDGEDAVERGHRAGLDWIREKAQGANQPAVINISLASHYGDHDGTWIRRSAIDRLLDETPTGLAVVVGAGNERDKGSTRERISSRAAWRLCRWKFPAKTKTTTTSRFPIRRARSRVSVQVTSPNGSVGSVVAAGSVGSATLERSVVTVSSSAPTTSRPASSR